MTDNHTTGLCCALVKSKGTRCTRSAQKGKDFCGTHLKSKNITRFDTLTEVSPLNISNNSNICLETSPQVATLIPIHHRSRIRYNTIKLRDIQKTLTHYGQNADGRKKELFDKLLLHFDSLLPFTKHTNQILSIQKWYRHRINLKITSLRQEFKSSRKDCVNDSDVLTLESLNCVPDSYLLSYKDQDGFTYGFDIRSLDKLLENSSDNPYTSKPFHPTSINRMKRLIKYLKIQGVDFNLNSEHQDDTEDLKYVIKRRIVKVFQEMDNLDQYTNPAWFLDLGLHSLNKFYKEAEDIWNYRLNLSKEIKSKIVPPDGKVFTVEPKNVLKEYNTRDKLRTLCLDVIEKLIYSAPERSDRVNGCIYVLLALVIVNEDAAMAMPSYYTMVTGDIGHANYLEVPI